MADTLTIPFALRLGDLLNWVAQSRLVHYTLDDGATILTGTLRHVVRGVLGLETARRQMHVQRAQVARQFERRIQPQ